MRRLIIRTKNEGFVLKQLIAADAKPYFSLVDRCRSHLSQYDEPTAAKHPTEMAVLDSILFPINPRKLRFGVWDHDVFVGMVGITPLPNGTGETGGWTGAEFCNNGYGTVAHNALADYALRKLGFQRIIAKTHPENAASQGMLGRAGYRRFRRTTRSHYFVFVGPLFKKSGPANPYRTFRQLERLLPGISPGNVHPS